MDKSTALRKRLSLFFVFCLISILSSCAQRSKTINTQSTQPPKSYSAIGDAQYEPNETSASLNKELEVLMNTGQWGSTTSEIPLLQQSINLKLYDFPIVLNSQVLAYMNLFQTAQREMFERWLARSGKYIPVMREELKKAGLPQDLVYLSMIESGFSPKAFSSAQAVGLWQFMNDTGRQYSLRIDDSVDERRHIEKSTKAAVAFLGDLYKDFGDWHLAVAAYNGGPNRVQIGLDRFGTRSFWDLAKEQYLPLETKRYVPKLIAAIIIAKEPEKYGFTNIQYEKAQEFETLAVGPNLDLDAIALVCETDTQTIKNLNLELNKNKTPANVSKYTVKIPPPAKEAAIKNLPRLQLVTSVNYRTHVVGKKDTLASVCDQHGITATSLLKANKLRSNKLISGKILQIPYEVKNYRLTSPNSPKEIIVAQEPPEIQQPAEKPVETPTVAVKAKSSPTALKHTVQQGDTLFSIAKQYKASQDDLLKWNKLSKANDIKRGQTLVVTANESKPLADTPASSSPILVSAAANSDKKTSQKAESAGVIKEASSSKTIAKDKPVVDQSNWYIVKLGDSLSSIAEKFKISANQIKQMNNMRTSMVQPGLRLKIRNG